MPSQRSDHSSGCGCLSLLTIVAGGVVAPIVFILPRWTQPNPRWFLQRESLQYVGAMNRGQQAHYREKGAFTSDIHQLWENFSTETQNYRYQTVMLDAIAVQNYGTSKDQQNEPLQSVKKVLQRYFSLGDYVERPLKSYTGLVWVTEDENGEEITMATLCESLEPTSEMSPKFDLKELPTDITRNISCPEGYEALE